MFAGKTSEAVERVLGVRPFVRTVPVLLLLFGLVFVHGACVMAGISSSGAAGSAAAASTAAEVTAEGRSHTRHHSDHLRAGHSQDHHHSDHVPCCGHAVEAGCVALLAASFLLLFGFSRCGLGTWLGVCRHLRWTLPDLRASPQGGLPRFALCVMLV